MRCQTRRKTLLAALIVCLLAAGVYSHCQIPCGIYDDAARLDSIAEHITTIEKSMKLIEATSERQDAFSTNQSVRWVQNKETHADALAEIVTYYFMTQRIKPVAKADSPEYAKYVKELTLLHQMLVSSMKAKQTVDTTHVNDLKEQLAAFKASYLGQNAMAAAGHTH